MSHGDILYAESFGNLFRFALQRQVGRPPFTRTTSTSTQWTPWLQPVPSAFIAASFIREAAGIALIFVLELLAVGHFIRCVHAAQYLSPCASITF